MATKIISTFKADCNRQIPDLVIDVDLPMPEGWTLEEQSRMFDQHAEMIYGALHDSLPGGLLHRLLIRMLKGYENDLRVPMERQTLLLCATCGHQKVSHAISGCSTWLDNPQCEIPCPCEVFSER